MEAMKSEKKPRRELSGVESDHGQVCRRCGCAYPNPHPSAKLRRAHRKHCASSIGGGSAATLTVLGAGDSGDLKKTGSEEDLESREEMALEESMKEREVPKSCEKEMLVKIDADDNTLELYASLIGNKIEGLECKQTTNELGDTSHFDQTVTQKIDNAVITEDAKGSYSSESKSHILDALKEQSSLQGKKDIGSAEDTVNGTLLDFARGTVPPGDSEINSFFIASKKQRIDDCMGANETLDDKSTVTSPMIILPSDLSSTLIKFDSLISVGQYKHTNEDGRQLSQQELFYKDGSSTLESNTEHNLDTSPSEPDNLVSELVGCQRNAKEAESECSLPAKSLTRLEEVSESKPEVHQEFPEDTTVHVIDVGVKSVYFLENEGSKVLPAELEVLGSKDIPSFAQINDKTPSCNGNGSVTKITNSNDGQYQISLPIDGDRFQLARECHFEAAIPLANRKNSEGLEVYLLEKQGRYPILEARIQDKDRGIHDTSSHGTFFSSAQSEELTLESLLDEHGYITTSSSEDTPVNCATVESFDIMVSNLSKTNGAAFPNGSVELSKQCNGAAETNSIIEFTSDEEEHNDNDVNVMEPTKEVIQKNCYAEAEKSSEGELQPQAQKVVNYTDIERNEMLKIETTTDQSGALSLQYAELSPRFSDNIAQSSLVQPADQKAPVERLGEKEIGRSLDQSDKRAGLCVKEVISEINLCKEHNKLDPCKTEDEIYVHANGSQLELQSISQVRIDEPAVNEEHNTESDYQISQTEKENMNIHNALNHQLHSNESTGVVLGLEDDPNLIIDELLTAISESQLLVKDPAPPVDSKDCSKSGVASSTYYPYPEQQEVHAESKQQPESFMQLIDDFMDSNGQTSNKEEPLSFKPDGTNPFLKAATNAVPFNNATSLPSDSQNEMSLRTSELEAENEVAESKTERDYISKTSPVDLAGPGERFVSNEIQSANGSSKTQPEGNQNEEVVSTDMAKANAEKPHVMLKRLLAEANNESRRKLMDGENDNSPPLTAKKIQPSENGQPMRTRSPSVTSEKSNASSDRQVNHKEWNSPARLPNSSKQNVKKKTKAKQGWIPFMCCQSHALN